MAISGAHHHGFTVSDIEQSLKFYRDCLGLEVMRISERKNLPSYDTIIGHKNIELKVAILCHPKNEFVMELFQYINPAGTRRELDNYYVGASHVAFEVDDIDVQYQSLRDAGYGSINPPVDVVREGKTVARAMYALDPDGISVEMFQEFEDIVK